MTAPGQPDIEIYVRDAGVEEIRAWLEKRLGSLAAEPARGLMAHFRAERDGEAIPVRVMPGAVAKHWTSVWLDSPDTPWASDLACARDCFSFIGKEVRCAAGGWHEDDEEDPDAFIRVDADGEAQISWKTT